MIYVGIFSLLILLRYSLLGHIKFATQIYPFVLAFLFIFSAFRFEIGCDWGNYRTVHLTTALPLDQIWYRFLSEPLHTLISKVLHFFNLSYLWVHVYSSSIFFYGVHKLAKRQPDQLGFLVLLFPILIINMPMSAIKQAAAIGVMCLAFIAFSDKKFWKYIFLTALAAGLHTSAIIFFALVPFIRGELTLQKILTGGLLAIPIIGLIFLSSAFETAVDRYVIDQALKSAGAIYRLGSLGISAFLFLVLFKNKWKTLFPEDYKIVLLGSLIMLSCLLVLPISSVIGDRVGYYLLPLQAIFFARLPYLSFDKYRPLLIAFPYIFLLILFILWTSSSALFKQCYIPYKNWVIGVPERERNYETDDEERRAVIPETPQ
jgi:hypothetical protein